MWSTQLLGTDLYHLVGSFVIYSILGWFVESVYMSCCNRKVTNRGFAKSPFCPIYGFGAVFGNLLLSPLKGNLIAMYLTGAVLATIFEFLVGKLMIRLFGELWWDYSEKPFNYKGILCLESTAAWGFYALGIVYFLNDIVYRWIDRIEMGIGVRAISVIMLIVLVDYIIQLCKALKVDINKKKDALVEKYQTFKARWY